MGSMQHGLRRLALDGGVEHLGAGVLVDGRKRLVDLREDLLLALGEADVGRDGLLEALALLELDGDEVGVGAQEAVGVLGVVGDGVARALYFPSC